MIFKSIRRVVSRADDLDVRSLYKILRAELVFSKTLVAPFPYLVAGLLRERQINIEISLQLKVSPVVERIADEVGHRACEGAEFLIIVRISRDVFLIYSVGAELTPLVMITAEKEIIRILELVVLGDHLRTQMAMIVDYRQILYLSVKLFCRLAFKHEIIVYKAHCFSPIYIM